MGIFARLFGGGGTRARPPADEAPAAKEGEVARESVAPRDSPAAPHPDIAAFSWFMDTHVEESAPLGREEAELLAWLDRKLPGVEGDSDLVPRARSVVPQLLRSLRDETGSLQDLSARVARDPSLVVEVMRMANGASFRGGQAVTELTQAISRLGHDGVRRAIARVLLRPIYESRPGTIYGRAADRLWLFSERKAEKCLRLAPSIKVDRFEAFLAGLLHNVGWTAVLRLIDRRDALSAPIFGGALVRGLTERRDLFFGTLLRSWQLSPSLDDLSLEIEKWQGLESARMPIARLLRLADREAAQELAQRAPEQDEGGGEPG